MVERDPAPVTPAFVSQVAMVRASLTHTPLAPIDLPTPLRDPHWLGELLDPRDTTTNGW
jgi:hypothetical protein